MSKPIVVVSLLLCAALGGCATLPPNKPFDAANRAAAHGREALVAVAQSEVNVVVNQSNIAAAGGGGLLLALIDVGINQHRASSAQDTLKPVRAALTDYKFDETALAAFQTAFAGVPWIDLKAARFTKDQTNDNYARMLDQSAADQLIYNNVDYTFSADMSTLIVGVKTSVYAKSVSGSTPNERLATENALYYNKFVHSTHLPDVSKDVAVNAAHWAQNNGIRARAALDAGLAEIARAAAADMSAGIPAAATVAAQQ